MKRCRRMNFAFGIRATSPLAAIGTSSRDGALTHPPRAAGVSMVAETCCGRAAQSHQAGRVRGRSKMAAALLALYFATVEVVPVEWDWCCRSRQSQCPRAGDWTASEPQCRAGAVSGAWCLCSCARVLSRRFTRCVGVRRKVMVDTDPSCCRSSIGTLTESGKDLVL